MKTIILMIILIWSSVAFAQIPNGGFEDWSVDNYGIYPTGYMVSSQIWTGSGVVNCEKITDHTQGQFALKLTSCYSSVYQAVIPGWAFSLGFPVSFKPISIYWDYKFKKYGNDPGGVIRVYLTKYDTVQQTSEIISDHYKIFNINKPDWTPAAMNLSYTQNEIPDSCFILIACGDEEYAVDSTWLIIDNLLFNTFIPVEENPDNQILFRTFPNPASDFTTIEILNTAKGIITYTLSGINGEILQKGDFMSDGKITRFPLSLPDLQTGLYFIRLQSQQFEQVQKLIINLVDN